VYRIRSGRDRGPCTPGDPTSPRKTAAGTIDGNDYDQKVIKVDFSKSAEVALAAA
jgi:hypothetical protein